MKKTVEVVGAVITNEQGEILCALRAEDMSMSGLWEFPGGKIEAGEAPKKAIVREIQEELGCLIEVHTQVEDTLHEYEHIIVRLLTFHANIKEGSPEAKEHETLRWVAKKDLASLRWAPADIPAVESLLS
ncbi:MAG TPA: 8-oxo-dGTP diphosphatase MutT [Myxococcales bacterium]|nr:8-oxo-dGTP diphosphatase MutT [Deltaproteobacteria bacterium]HAA54782.1 8-oxo-dGTP diphosphatase MutT [Myxococcales bacterium]|tara:strand:+ start:7342 stop:7731 length:390 start_codon:yes stop_codon:yes gene_type:complete